MMPLSALKRVQVMFITAAKNMLKQEGREHAPLTKALFHSEPPRAHPVVEPHACSHAIVELTNDRDHILWHALTIGQRSTVQRRDRSTESYALVRSIEHTAGFVSSAPAPVADESQTFVVY